MNEPIKSAPATADALSGFLRAGSTTHINVLPMESHPEIWGLVSPDLREEYNASCITSKRLSSLLKSLTPDKLTLFIEGLGDLACFSRKWSTRRSLRVENLPTAEDEKLRRRLRPFGYDAAYAIVFYDYLCQHRRIPKLSQYVLHWMRLNKAAMRKNLDVTNDQSASGWTRRDLSCSDTDAIRIVKRGAIYRASKTYAALLRELDALSRLTVPRFSDKFGGELQAVCVWVHVLLDVGLHADALLVGADGEIHRASIYFQTNLSKKEGERKNKGVTLSQFAPLNIPVVGRAPLGADGFETNGVKIITTRDLEITQGYLQGNEKAQTVVRQRGGIYD